MMKVSRLGQAWAAASAVVCPIPTPDWALQKAHEWAEWVGSGLELDFGPPDGK